MRAWRMSTSCSRGGQHLIWIVLQTIEREWVRSVRQDRSTAHILYSVSGLSVCRSGRLMSDIRLAYIDVH